MKDIDNEPRTPLWVRCQECDHAWIGLYLPMPMSTCAKAMGRLTCPMCATGSKRISITDPQVPA